MVPLLWFSFKAEVSSLSLSDCDTGTNVPQTGTHTGSIPRNRRSVGVPPVLVYLSLLLLFQLLP